MVRPGLLLLCLATSLVEAQATRADLVAYLGECVRAGQAADPIARFGTDYRGFDLREVDFKGMHRVGFETNLGGADFTGADLRGADFGASTLTGACFRDADLREASFVTANLVRADLRGAALAGSRFRECDFTGANLMGVDLRQVELGEWNFFFHGAILEQANLSGLYLGSAHLDRARLGRADLSRADLRSATFDGADLAEANLTGSDLTRASLRGANLEGALLAGSTIRHADFREVRGLSPAERDRLEQASGREAYESEVSREAIAFGALQIAKVLVYLAAITLAALMALRERWRTSKYVRFALLADQPILAPPLLAFVFLVAGGHSTVQMSASRELWSLWGCAWPLMVLALPVAAFLLLCLFIAVLVREPFPGVAVVAFFVTSLAASWVALSVLFAYFPSA